MRFAGVRATRAESCSPMRIYKTAHLGLQWTRGVFHAVDRYTIILLIRLLLLLLLYSKGNGSNIVIDLIVGYSGDII